MIKKMRFLFASAVLAIPSLAPLIVVGTAHAATITWTGAGTDGNWSTAANWSGNVAPAAGDSVVIDNSAIFANTSTDNIAGLSLASILFINDSSSSSVEVKLATGLTITGAIKQDTSDTKTLDQIGDNGSSQTLTLGGFVVVTAASDLTIGQPGDVIALAGHHLTFTDNGGTTPHITAVESNITGSGDVIYSGPATNYQVSGANTYSGTTEIAAANLPVANTNNNNAFGTSAITVDASGAISFEYNASTTISNPITIAGTTSTSLVTSLDFSNTGAGTTITVPAITLNGKTRFANDNSSSNPLTINLAGITANGFCIEYLGYGNDASSGPANGFTNGPAGCVVATATPPKTPNTGAGLAQVNPTLTIAGTIMLAGGIYGASRMSKLSAPKRQR